MPLAVVAFDDFTDTFGQELDLHTPDLGIAGWEYDGSWFTLGGGPPADPTRTQRQSGGAGAFIRSTADVTAVVFTGPFTIFGRAIKGAVDDTLANGLFGFFIRGSGTVGPGSEYDGEGVWVGWQRTSSTTADMVAIRRIAGGAIAETLNWGSVSLGGATQKQFTCNVAADGVTLEMIVADAFTGASPTNLGFVVLSADIRDADHQRIGLSNAIVGSGVSDFYMYQLLQDAQLLNPWTECDPCAGPTVWVDSACPVIPAAAFSAGFDGGFE